MTGAKPQRVTLTGTLTRNPDGAAPLNLTTWARRKPLSHFFGRGVALLVLGYCLWEFSQGNGPRDDWRVYGGLK